MAATFAVHPYMTTRAKSAELQQVANTALQLLRVTNSLVGPIAARFDVAFAFTHFAISRHGGRRLIENDSNGTRTIVKDDSEPLNFELAQTSSLWSRAEDFWQVVGWAFNCSAFYRKRWERWRLWLEFMCDVLEDDWKERRRRQTEGSHGGVTAPALSAQQEILKESLLLKYVNTTSGVSGRNRRIMRAIFADGSSSALNEFREIFHNEPRELNQDQDRPQKRQVDVNIDEDIYGDYIGQDNEDDLCEEEPTAAEKERRGRPKRLRRTATRSNSQAPYDSDGPLNALSKTHSDDMTQLDDPQALKLRQRLLHLLSDASLALPEDFMSIDELYTLLAEFIRHLPLPVFQLLVSPSVLTGMSEAAQTTICETLLFRLLEPSAPEPEEIYVDQKKLVECFLPYAANTYNIIDNAKVSLLLESLMRLLHVDGKLRFSPFLKEATETGIIARASKSQSDTKKSQAKRRTEEVGWTWLIESGERMTYLLDRLSAAERPASQPSLLIDDAAEAG